MVQGCLYRYGGVNIGCLALVNVTWDGARGLRDVIESEALELGEKWCFNSMGIIF